ncbi:MAG: NUDIX hydrolase [Deltaproteobacteria bacterium]|nr:NUDIX hydrolase [Deltaproteobacteria bacterium]
MTRRPERLRPWMPHAAQPVYDCRVFSITEHRRRSPRTGELHDFYVLDSPDWVNIIPLTADRQVVMILQYRHGIDEFTLEVPGGMVDEADASPLEAGRREMREETGYDSEDVVPLGVIHPNPAIQNNRCHSFLARDVRLAGPVAFDTTEETEVVLVPLDDVPELIRGGVISHALVVVAFHHLLLKGAG